MLGFGRRGFAVGIALTAALVAAPGVSNAQLGVRWVLNEVTADFAVSEGHPLIKTKFNLYDPVGPTTAQFDQNVGLLSELNVDNYRIELGWGRSRTGIDTHTGVGGTAERLEYDFGPLEHIVKGLWEQNVQLLSSYSYTPFPLQDPRVKSGAETAAPVDMEKWGEAVAAYARHFNEIGMPFGVHEIWNEPDGRAVFFSGKESEYQRMYEAGVRAIRAVDPDAVVAGPASAPGLYWIRSFPEFVAAKGLPLDYLTYHAYGSSELALEYTDSAVASLNRHQSLLTASLSLDEWHNADCCSWCEDDVRQTHEGAAQLLHDFLLFLTRPELASVSWAWFQDPAGQGGQDRPGCMGLVTRDGRRKAVFNAWKIYAMMPVDRKRVKVRGPFEAMASSDAHKAALVIWNRDPYDRWISGIHLRNVPFSKGDIRIYRIDAQHASVNDGADENLVPVETFNDVFFHDTEWTWSGVLPSNGVLYVEAVDRSGLSELTPVNVGRVVRINRYYPARGQTPSYADFDRKTWIARLGMMGDERADQRIGVVAADLPDVLDVTVEVDGELQRVDASSLLAIRVDYRVNGEYARSVVYHGPHGGVDLYDPAAVTDMPWGLRPSVDEVVAVPDLARFTIPLRGQAPRGWNGTVHISFVMRSAGPDARAKFVVRPG